MAKTTIKKGADYNYLVTNYTKMLMTDAESTIVRLERVISDLEGTLTYGNPENLIQPIDLLFDEFEMDVTRNDIVPLKKAITFLDGLVKRLRGGCNG